MCLRGLAVIVALVVTGAAGAPAQSYVWCAAMERAGCCCPMTEAASQSEQDTCERTCCDVRSIEAVATAAISASSSASVLPALGTVVVLDAPSRRATRLADARAWARASARAGPTRRLHAVHSVFLI